MYAFLIHAEYAFLLYAVAKVFYYMRWAQIFNICIYMQWPCFEHNKFDHSSAALNRTDVRPAAK